MSKIYLKSYGCSANTADAEIARGILTKHGHYLVDNPQNAELNIILTCVVKKPTEQKVSKELRRMEVTEKPLIVAGCMPKSMTEHVEELVPNASLIGPDDIERIGEAVNLALKGEQVSYLNGEPTDRTCLPRIRENNIVHIMPISSGCLGNCSYCIVKFARGKLYSFPAKKIVKDVKDSILSGCKEVWITAEDTATYNSEGVRLPELLNRITSINGEFRVRIGMTTPNQLEPVLGDLLESLKSHKIYQFIHIPVQSGNDEILKQMKRRYTIQQFKKAVNQIRKVYPSIGISTDIICGFPGETLEQFNDSLKLIKWLRPDVLNINRFWERPGTDASKMPGQLHGRETKKRSRIITSLWKELAVEAGNRWIGWEGEILIIEHGKRGTKVGRNPAYKAVAVKTVAPMGSFINVRVENSGVGYLTAVEI
jgi:MiaB-like tRNA modifying enzyme